MKKIFAVFLALFLTMNLQAGFINLTQICVDKALKEGKMIWINYKGEQESCCKIVDDVQLNAEKILNGDIDTRLVGYQTPLTQEEIKIYRDNLNKALNYCAI